MAKRVQAVSKAKSKISGKSRALHDDVDFLQEESVGTFHFPLGLAASPLGSSPLNRNSKYPIYFSWRGAISKELRDDVTMKPLLLLTP